MKKNEKKEKVINLESVNFEGDLEKTIAFLQEKMKAYRKDGYFKFLVNKETQYDYGCPEGYDYYYLDGVRLETDEEFTKRLANSKIRSIAAKEAAKTKAIKKEERERKQYLKLHAKYKGKV